MPGSPSKFESADGNMTVGAAGNTDWNCFTAITSPVINVGSTCGVTGKKFSSTGNPYLASPADAYTANDPAWPSGQKMDHNTCITATTKKSPAKDTFTQVASYTETALSGGVLGDTYLYGATIRQTANGSASENLELNQYAPGGTSANPNSCTGAIFRTEGDKLIAINYTNGGASATFTVDTWVATSAGFTLGGVTYSGTCIVGSDTPPCWSSTVTSLGSNTAEGEVNANPIAAGDNGMSGQDLVAAQFAEFGIDLTAANVLPANTCEGFAQSTWESRSSGSSFSSNPEDLEFENVPISNCGTIKVVKNTDPRNVPQNFAFTSNLPANSGAGGVACTTTSGSGVENATTGIAGSFCLNDDGTTGHNFVQESGLNPGTYNIDEPSEPTGFGFESVTCTDTTTSTDLVHSTTDPTVSFSLPPQDTVVCTYVNKQQRGAIKVTKDDTKSTPNPLSGATFEICMNNGPYSIATPCSSAGTVETGTGTASSSIVTGTDGTVCVDGLAFGTYYVTEKAAPTGYGLSDATTHSVTVNTNGGCSDTVPSGQSLAFTDPPLTDLTVIVASDATGGNAGTKSNISCVASGTTTDIGNSPQPADIAGHTQFAASAEVDAHLADNKALTPGTYVCTIVVDP